MLTDALNNFLPVGSNLAVTNVAVPSNVYDMMGSGVGTAPPNIIGNPSLFGTDMGIGLWRPQVACATGSVAWAGGTSLTIAFQAAPDTATTHVAGAWTTLMDIPGIPVAQLTANAVIGRFDFPPAIPPGLNARYLRLLFTPTGTFTAGVIAFALVTLDRDDQANKFAGSNFKVA